MILALLLSAVISAAQEQPCAKGKAPFIIAMHGGLGEGQYTPEVQQQRKALMQASLDEAKTALSKGALAIDVIEPAIARLEDSGVFNTGKGGVTNSAGLVTLDSSIMDGKDKSVGAIANFKTIKNPIRAAHAALKAGNRFFVGPDAENFSPTLEHVKPDYFINANKKKTSALDKKFEDRFGTVGAIVLDRCGNMAAGTSTGGYPEKPVGRVGDSPLIGAATYAENGTCAVSTTGEGEYFIRSSAAHEVCAQMKYGHKEIHKAAKDVIENQIRKLGGHGGVIVLDAKGHFAVSYIEESWGLLTGYASETAGAIGSTAPKKK